LWIDSGTRYDVPSKSGTAQFLGRLTRQRIEEQLGPITAQLNTYTCREKTVYSARVLKADASKALQIISDAILNPRLDKQTFEKEKENYLRSAIATSKNYQDRVDYYLHETAFMETGMFPHLLVSSGPHPYCQVSGLHLKELRTRLPT
jgi:predicted Zn-dependent peptidase